jgi:6-pyruvoyltetrahydropterin/6-carboxytetrahydropterin synthase
VRTQHRIEVARERYKFSCAHMTVFPGGRKERLHGHNYYLSLALDLADVSFAKMIDFAVIKDALAALCEEWKEHLLLPRDNPHLELLARGAEEIEFRLCGRRYVIPADEVLLLPIDNVSVEALASHAAERLLTSMGGALGPAVVGLEVRVEENPGQGGSCYRMLTE